MFGIEELIAMIKVKRQMSNLTVALEEDQVDLKFCYDILQHVSRSFAAVIIQLNPELRDAVCIFYLVLRGLDTVEDDMHVSLETKKVVLPTFHEKLLTNDWHICGIGKGEERRLLEEFFRVSRVFQQLKPKYQDVISDICYRMAMGMLHFLQNEVVSVKDYDLYCHYVAGLVGHGLTRLFTASGFESPEMERDLEVANSMGLFLQKVNIIRDYYEDIMEIPVPRMFWPREVWGKFGDKLNCFKEAGNRRAAVECLNALIADALRHVPHCLDYMSSLKEPSIFMFCAIPQVMAIATLATLYDNERVFCDKVKIRKGLACTIMLNCDNLSNVLDMFKTHMDVLASKLREEDPSYDLTRHRLQIGNARLKELQDTTPSVARNFFTHYPALGGKAIYSIVDTIGGMFRA